MAWNQTIQRRGVVPGAGQRMEFGRVAAASVSGQTFNVSTKFGRVFSGNGVMVTDGLIAYVTTGVTSSGVAVFTRLGPVLTSADYIDYVLFGL